MSASAPGGPAQFVAFVGVGGVAALANFGSRFVFATFVGFEASVLLAFWIGLVTAFVLNRRYVFSEARSSTWQTEAVRFLIVNLAGLVVTMVAAVLALRILDTMFGTTPVTEGAAHLAGLGATAVTSYLGHKFWTFRA